jgi:hypothetical protein
MVYYLHLHAGFQIGSRKAMINEKTSKTWQQFVELE